MKLSSPFNTFKINQKFGENLNASYEADGYLGHTGLDLDCIYGEAIKSCSDGIVIAIEKYSDPTMKRYVSILTENYVISYYHLSEIAVKEMQVVKQGEVIGKAGNVGGVFIGDKPLTEEQRKQGLGTHLHLELKQIQMVKNTKNAIRNGKLKDVKIGKMKLEVVNENNGYGGCINPLPFFPPVRATDISANGLSLIAMFEGFSLKPYQDVSGIWTIGYGSTYDLNNKKITKDTQPITSDMALQLLKKAVSDVCNFINSNIKCNLTQNQYDAICSIGYNIGVGNLGKSNLLKNLNNGKPVIADNFLSWNKSKGKFVQGLYNRRVKEWELYTTP